MIETDLKKLKDAEWMKQHELTDDQFERLIENKFIRASVYRKALEVQEHNKKVM
jgi:hypothetical protein